MTSTPPPALTLRQKLGYFLISLMMNAVGNALTVTMALGSTMWTAASYNLSQYLSVQLSTILLLNAFLGIAMNIYLDRKIDWKFILGNFVFVLPFSYLVQYFVGLFSWLGLGQLPWLLRLVADVLGIFLISAAVSIYQRINWIIHPLDEVVNTIRFRYFNGNPVLAQLALFSIPVTTMVVLFCLTGNLEAVNIGTIVVLFFQGAWIGWSDKHIFPGLPHYFRH